MKKLNFEREISAPKEKVWKIMLEHGTYEEWTRAFSENSTYEGDWSKGSVIKFIDTTGNGMFSMIAENIEGVEISIKHQGMIKDGIIDTESELVKQWAPSFENYYFEAINENTTKLKIEIDVPDEYEQQFSEMWPKALTKLKEICER